LRKGAAAAVTTFIITPRLSPYMPRGSRMPLLPSMV